MQFVAMSQAAPDAAQLHQITPIAALGDALGPHPTIGSRVEPIATIYPKRVEIVPIAFGHRDLSGRSIAEHPRSGAWADTSYQASSQTVHVLHDATVRSELGIVTIDGHVVAETLAHVPPQCLGGERVDGGIAFTANDAEHQLGRVAHLMAGGYDNYYHWMTDVVARTTLADAVGPGATPLFGIFCTPFQPSTAALLGPSGTPRQGLPTGMSLRVQELIYVPLLSGYGFEPHPFILPVFDRLRAHAGVGQPTRRLYVTRIGSERRPLLNEAEVEALLSMHGFQTVQLDGLAVRDQVLLFAEASHIVAPHGAGLTNLLFCTPGTAVLELLPSNYVNWCFRRLASLRQLHYGCLVGEAEGVWNEDWPHANGWTLPLEELAALLRSDVFVSSK